MVIGTTHMSTRRYSLRRSAVLNVLIGDAPTLFFSSLMSAMFGETMRSTSHSSGKRRQSI